MTPTPTLSPTPVPVIKEQTKSGELEVYTPDKKGNVNATLKLKEPNATIYSTALEKQFHSKETRSLNLRVELPELSGNKKESGNR